MVKPLMSRCKVIYDVWYSSFAKWRVPWLPSVPRARIIKLLIIY